MVATTRTEAKRLIDAIDLTPFVIKARKAKTLRWWDVGQAQKDYRQFLYLVWLNIQQGDSEFVVPTQLADALWHEHILYTADYRSFTDALYGKYLDHFPGLRKGTLESSRAIAHTRSLYRNERKSSSDSGSGSSCYTSSYLGESGSSTSSSSSHSHGSSCGSHSASSCGSSCGGGGCGGGCGGS